MSENINYPYIVEYLRSILPKRDSLLEEIENKSKLEESYVPIAEPETAQLLRVLARLSGGGDFLEIGTGCAYSSIILARETQGKITTIERYSKAAGFARENIEKAGLSGRIELLEGEAADILPTLSNEYGLVFLDAAKGQYPAFLPHILRVLKNGGILVSDNVLYKGMTAERKLLIRRKITIVKRLRIYLKTLFETEELTTCVLPLGDGVAISVKGDKNA